MCFDFFRITDTSDDVIRPCTWSCDNTGKIQSLPGKLLCQDFFIDLKLILILIITMLCIDFVLFLKGEILREFQNIEKFVIF